MNERGLVTRRAPPQDERSTLVTITDEGRAVLVKVFPRQIEVVKAHLFGSLSPENVEMLARVMGHITRHLRRSRRGGRVPASS